MNKRILSIMMCVVLVAVMVVMAVPASAAHHDSTTLFVTAEKTEAAPNDVIDFTVAMGPVSDLGTLQMTLTIPEGLTYVPNSGKIVSGQREAMGFDTLDWTEESLMINGVASEANYESDVDTVLGTFQCTVNEGFEGQASVQLGNLEFYDCQDWNDNTDRFSVSAAIITVGGGADTPVATTPTEADDTDETAATEADDTDPTQIDDSSATQPATQPAGTATPSQAPTSAAKNTNSPKTSDSGMIFVWIGLVAVALIGAGIAFFAKKKKNG